MSMQTAIPSRDCTIDIPPASAGVRVCQSITCYMSIETCESLYGVSMSLLPVIGWLVGVGHCVTAHEIVGVC